MKESKKQRLQPPANEAEARAMVLTRQGYSMDIKRLQVMLGDSKRPALNMQLYLYFQHQPEGFVLEVEDSRLPPDKVWKASLVNTVTRTINQDGLKKAMLDNGIDVDTVKSILEADGVVSTKLSSFVNVRAGRPGEAGEEEEE